MINVVNQLLDVFDREALPTRQNALCILDHEEALSEEVIDFADVLLHFVELATDHGLNEIRLLIVKLLSMKNWCYDVIDFYIWRCLDNNLKIIQQLRLPTHFILRLTWYLLTVMLLSDIELYFAHLSLVAVLGE